MKTLRNASTLEYNVSGIIVSLRIPSSEILKVRAENGVAEINCRSFFSKVTPKAPTAVQAVEHSDPVNSGAAGPVFGKPLVTNRFDNIIDQLERKYYCGSIVQPARDENSDSEGSSSVEGDENEGAAREPVKSSKKKVFADDYDMDDPFIDDEEMIYEVEAEIKKNRTKTKHDGFFVSSGKLEVLTSPKKVQRSQSAGGTSKGNGGSKKASGTGATTEGGASAQAPSSSAADTTTAAAVPAAGAEGTAPAGEAKEAKKRKRRSKSEMEEARALKAQKAAAAGDSAAAPSSKGKIQSPAQLAIRAAAPMLSSLSNVSGVISGAAGTAGQSVSAAAAAAPSASILLDPVDPSATQDGPPSATAGAGAAARPKVEKEVWQPNDQVLSAIEAFRVEFAKTGIKLAKSSNIPKSLEDALHTVDTAVLQHLSAEVLARTAGYFEALQAAMGGEVQTGKLRSLMTRLRLRDRAATTLRAIEEMIVRLQADLKAATAPCPEKLQPSFKAAKKEKAALAKTGEGLASGVVVCSGTQESSGAGNKEVDGSGALTKHGETGNAVEAAQGLIELQAERSAAANPSVEATEGATTASNSSTAALTRYEYWCNWSPAMKKALCEIERLLRVYVVQENQYREKLTVHDKKFLSEADTATLVEKDVVSGYLALLCEGLPDSCLQGNVTYMRRVITMSKVSKEKGPAQRQSSGGSGGTGASAPAAVQGGGAAEPAGGGNEDSMMSGD